MSYTPTSELGQLHERARNLLAGCAAWRTLCGVDSPEEARPFIHYGMLPGNPHPDRPLALIEDFSAEARKTSADDYNGSGLLEIGIEADTPEALAPAGSESDAWLWFIDLLGKLRDQITEQLRTGGAADVTNLMIQSASIFRSGRGELAAGQGDYFEGTILLRWGEG